jgi:hypothetical protein
MYYANSVQQVDTLESLNSPYQNVFADIYYIPHISHFAV